MIFYILIENAQYPGRYFVRPAKLISKTTQVNFEKDYTVELAVVRSEALDQEYVVRYSDLFFEESRANLEAFRRCFESGIR